MFTRMFAVGGLLVIAASLTACTTAGTPVAQQTTSSAVSQVGSTPANAALTAAGIRRGPGARDRCSFTGRL